MSALSFDPWSTLNGRSAPSGPPNPPNLPNPPDPDPGASGTDAAGMAHRSRTQIGSALAEPRSLGELGALGGKGISSTRGAIGPEAQANDDPDLPESAKRTLDPSGWTADDWCECFNERIAVAMIDGEQPEPEARRIAHECCVVRWLEMYPATSEPDRCVWCGKADAPGNIVPFGAEPAGHVWLHPRCWPSWFTERRDNAAAALAELGVAK